MVTAPSLRRRLRRLGGVVALAATLACGSFEDPAVVIDLRVLAMVADPVEQLVPYQPGTMPDINDIDLQPATICALIADPGASRRLAWTMKACGVGNDLRCEADRPSFAIGSGSIDDPEESAAPAVACATLMPGADLFAILVDALEEDPLAGFGGIDLQVEMTVTPMTGDDEPIVASKRLRFAPQIPVERTPNQNPTLERFDVTFEDQPASEPQPLPLGRCRDQATPLVVPGDQRINILPVEPATARETYVVPTFEGGSRTFTENLSYQWLAGAGDFSPFNTGGTRDAFGNVPELDTFWRPPDREDLPGDTVDVPIWIVQRDERLGAAWYQSCLRVNRAATSSATAPPATGLAFPR